MFLTIIDSITHEERREKVFSISVYEIDDKLGEEKLIRHYEKD